MTCIFEVNIEINIMQRTLIIIGIIFLLAGLLWPWLVKLPIGRLPGDIIIDKPNFKVYIPITTMIIFSLLLTLIFWLFRK
jgi:hypothetical protein